jgi:uncharacterized protein YdaU (DUF1376 family)
MSKYSWFRFDTLEFWRMTSKARLTSSQQGALISLLCRAWERNGELPGDMSLLRRMISVHAPDLEHAKRFASVVQPVLERCFKQSNDGAWRSAMLDACLIEAERIADAQRMRANKRWKNNGGTDATTMPAQCNGNADAMPIHTDIQDKTDIQNRGEENNRRASRTGNNLDEIWDDETQTWIKTE